MIHGPEPIASLAGSKPLSVSRGIIHRYCGLPNKLRIGAYGRASFTTTVLASGVSIVSTILLVGLPKAFLLVFFGAVWKRSKEALTSAASTAWPLTGGLLMNLAFGCSLNVSWSPSLVISCDAARSGATS